MLRAKYTRVVPKHYKVKLRQLIFPIGPSIAYVPLTQGLFACIEAWDAEIIGRSNWHASTDKVRGSVVSFYARRAAPDDKKMHQILLTVPDGYVSDHRNGHTLDNRRIGNLRIATIEENNRNRRIRHDSSSGEKGVFQRENGSWRGQVNFNGKKHDCGTHAIKQDAVNAVRKMYAELHGDFNRN